MAIRILAIDDSNHFRIMLKHALKKTWPEVELIEYDPKTQPKPGPDFDWSAYQVLLLDYQLGVGETGLDWLKTFPTKSDQFPITLMLTGEGSETIAVQAMKLDVEDYLSKTVSPKHLVATIQDALRARGYTIDDNKPAATGVNIAAAIQENRLTTHFQPIVGMGEGTVTDLYEVFLRLIGPNGELIMPADFLPQANQQNLTQFLDRWVVRSNLSRTLRLGKLQHRKVCQFVNLCEASLVENQFIPWFIRLLDQAKKHNIGPLIGFEIDLGLFTRYQAVIAPKIRQLNQEHGCIFSLVGCRYDDLTEQALKQVPFAFGKLDRQLVADATAGDAKATQQLAQTIVNLHAHHAKAIVEYIEDPATFATAIKAGADYTQGYFAGAVQDHIDEGPYQVESVNYD